MVLRPRTPEGEPLNAHSPDRPLPWPGRDAWPRPRGSRSVRCRRSSTAGLSRRHQRRRAERWRFRYLGFHRGGVAVVPVWEGGRASRRGRSGLQLCQGHQRRRAKRRIVQYRESGTEAVPWSSSGKATVLQDVGGAGFSQAFAIVNDIQARALELPIPTPIFPQADAVLWSPSGKATVLQDVGGLGDERSSRH